LVRPLNSSQSKTANSFQEGPQSISISHCRIFFERKIGP
jgi:hypothetical protein